MSRIAPTARAALVLAALAAGAAGCARDSELLEDRVEIRDAFAADLAGRSFSIRTLAVEAEPARVLQIEGDGVIVSLRSAAAPPLLATVRGDGVEWGGTRFEATATPNAFLVDGRPETLPAPGIYHFDDGAFAGQYPFQ